MTKKDLSETDICDRYITPAIAQAGWKPKQIRREFGFTDGQMIVRGKMSGRGKRKRADYLLYYPENNPIAVVEAKDNQHSLGAGMQQALGYAAALQIPFVFSSNGDGFLFHDKSGTATQLETELSLEEFPSPEALWAKYQEAQGLKDSNNAPLLEPYFKELDGKTPRYYQQLAVNRTVEAIAKGQTRCLLVMATGSGKTYTVFNIIWKLWKAGTAKRILFLADRNALVDQTIINDFRPFGEVMTKLNRKLLDKTTGQLNTSFQIYLGIYQAIIGEDGQDNLYEKFDRDFFDLIVIDECHRGSAKDDSNWRQVLDYFGSAIQVGLTATPKETKYASNIDYFGEPIFTYSLKQGIEDGFLAPFRVIRVDLDKDKDGWRPSPGQRDDRGELIEDRVFNLKDFDRNITFAQRTELVASYVSHFLHDGDPMRKTIVFCEQIDQAEEMRQALVNVDLNKELVQQDHRYVMRITGDEKEGKAQLDNFINPKEDFPVIATTSKLMTTGVDAQTCHVIVLDRQIKSMTEFKQIIGRGTRLRPDYEKSFFTIIDFRGATDLFKDEDWDGPPIQDEDFGNDPPSQGNGDGEKRPAEDEGGTEGEEERSLKYQVGSESFAVVRERTSVYDSNGKLTQESLRDYTRKQVGEQYASLDQFIKRWNAAEKKQAILDELQQQNVPIELLEQMVGEGYDPLDLICHVAFDQPPLTRRERAEQVRKRDVFTKYGEQARAVLEALLEKYADQGVRTLENREVLKLEPFAQMGTVVELVGYFGGKRGYLKAVQELEKELYEGEGAVS